jgi:hypothetical protein
MKEAAAAVWVVGETEASYGRLVCPSIEIRTIRIAALTNG